MSLSVDQALQVAVQMERLGHTFYESLAEACAQPKIASIASALAREELKHLETFEEMRRALPADQRGRTLTERELFSTAKQLRNTILPAMSEVRRVVLRGNVVEALDMAIKMEATAVAYYSELASRVTDKDAAVLKRIAGEERKHLSSLEDQRRCCTNATPKRTRS
jgi:rubrerythrin